jgi:hypothetical protein
MFTSVPPQEVEVDTSHDEAPLVAESPAPSQRRLVLKAILLSVAVCALVAGAVYSQQGPRGVSTDEKRGVVQLDEIVKVLNSHTLQHKTLQEKAAELNFHAERLFHKGTPRSNMLKARAKMTEQTDALHKKVASMQRNGRPNRLQGMKKRFQTAKTRLQKSTDKLKDQLFESKLNKLPEAQAKPLRESRRVLNKASTATPGQKASGKSSSPQQRKLLQTSREDMKTKFDSLKSKLAGYRRADRPNRLHDVRNRLEEGKAKLAMHIKNLNTAVKSLPSKQRSN